MSSVQVSLPFYWYLISRYLCHHVLRIVFYLFKILGTCTYLGLVFFFLPCSEQWKVIGGKKNWNRTVWLQGCFQRDHLRLTNFYMDVFSAKVKMVDLVIDLNLPMSSLDKLSKGMKTMFRDSKIGKWFQCARSKGTAIAKEMSALLLSMSALFLLENPLHYD